MKLISPPTAIAAIGLALGLTLGAAFAANASVSVTDFRTDLAHTHR